MIKEERKRYRIEIFFLRKRNCSSKYLFSFFPFLSPIALPSIHSSSAFFYRWKRKKKERVSRKSWENVCWTTMNYHRFRFARWKSDQHSPYWINYNWRMRIHSAIKVGKKKKRKKHFHGLTWTSGAAAAPRFKFETRAVAVRSWHEYNCFRPDSHPPTLPVSLLPRREFERGPPFFFFSTRFCTQRERSGRFVAGLAKFDNPAA